MKHANPKMMDRIAEVENHVLGGLVLDDQGKWVSIADKKALEEDFLVHLEAGRVLHNGQWKTFADAKKHPDYQHAERVARKPSEEEETEYLAWSAGKKLVDRNAPETVLINLSKEPNRYPASTDKPSEEEETAAIDFFPQETKAFQIQPSMAEAEETTIDDSSSYTMETGLFILDQSIEEAQSFQAETKLAIPLPPAPLERKTQRLPLAHLSLPTWDKEESLHKKQNYFIGGVIVAFIGIAALILIVLQVLR